MIVIQLFAFMIIAVTSPHFQLYIVQLYFIMSVFSIYYIIQRGKWDILLFIHIFVLFNLNQTESKSVLTI